MIHLDTHATIWLHDGDLERFPLTLRDRLNRSIPMISPMVRLELMLLHEVGRLRSHPLELLASLEARIDLRVAESSFTRVIAIAGTLTWTRDPFDRMIAAHALADDVPLVTKDATMLANCLVARWN